MLLNPIPTSQGQNQPLYERHVTNSGRNRVNVGWIVKNSLFYSFYGTLSFGGCGGQGC